jgi:hypothetical protein
MVCLNIHTAGSSAPSYGYQVWDRTELAIHVIPYKTPRVGEQAMPPKEQLAAAIRFYVCGGNYLFMIYDTGPRNAHLLQMRERFLIFTPSKRPSHELGSREMTRLEICIYTFARGK